MNARTVGRYRIVAKLGEGGMGEVYQAEDPLLERTVALKFLSTALAASAEARERFLREARIASTLHHSGIATVFDTGEADGQVYIAMLYVDGETLQERLRRETLPVQEAVRIVVEAGEALAHAHAKGVVHRDISSRNIMIDKSERVVVVDFGLALPKERARLTQPGALMGTLAYIAPEIVQGGEATARADVYSLGVVLFEALTRRLPFSGSQPEALLFAAVHEEPPSPIRERPEIPEVLGRIVQQALAKDPEQRFASVLEFVHALERMGLGQPRQAPAQAEVEKRTVPRSPRKGWMRVPKSLVLLGAIALILMAFIATQWRKDEPDALSERRRIAVLPFHHLGPVSEESASLCNGIAMTLVTKLTKLTRHDGPLVIPWSTSGRYAVDPQSPELIARELKVDALVVGTFSMAGNRIRIHLSLLDAESGVSEWVEEFEEPHAEVFELQKRVALAAASQLKGRLKRNERDEVERLASKSVEAQESYYLGVEEFKKGGREAAERAFEYFQRAIVLDPRYAEAYVGLGAVHSDRFFFGWGGEEELELAEARYLEALHWEPEGSAARGGLARVYWEKGESENCLKLLQHRSLRDGSLESLYLRAEIFLLGGLVSNAIELLEQIRRIDPASQGALWFLVPALVWAQRYEEAVEAAQQYVIDFDPDPEVLCWAAMGYQMMGDLEQAEVYYDQAIRLFREGSNVYIFSFAGDLQEKKGNPVQAREYWLQGTRIAESLLRVAPDNFRIHAFWAELQARLDEGERLWETTQALLGGLLPIGEYCYDVALHHALRGELDRAAEVSQYLLDHGLYHEHLYWLIEFLALGETMEKPAMRDFFLRFQAEGERLRHRYVAGI